MSEPPPIPPEAYSIDPDRQCGVHKSDGNRCSVRLNCLLHTEAEKDAIPRSKKYQQLLKLQPPSLALDFRPTLGVPVLPSSGRLAWISDPNLHCSVPLTHSDGLPGQAGIAACAEHSLEQMSFVRGRCACVDEIRRVLKANRDIAGNTKAQFDADVHCGVKRNGFPCTQNLRCSRHLISDKQAVPRNTGFRGRYYDLVALQLALLPAFESLAPTETPEVAKDIVDTDVRCGVLRNAIQACPNALNSSDHTEGQKLEVSRSIVMREIDLQTREAALTAGEVRLANDKLKDDDMKAREASLREKELATREARLADDKLRNDDMSAREARLAALADDKLREDDMKAREASLREKELAAREARLADERVRDAELAAREARLADQEGAMHETLKEREADLLAQHEKRTQELQNERDLALSNTRAQRDAILQSIRDLKTSLRNRSAAYQDELTGIATQIDSTTTQIASATTQIEALQSSIEVLQSSVEGLRLQRDNVASRYQAEKAKMEEEANELREKITASLG